MANDARATGTGYPMLARRRRPGARFVRVLLLVVGGVLAAVAAAALVIAPSSTARPEAPPGAAGTGPCDEPVARSQELVSTTVLGGSVGGRCAGPVARSPRPLSTPTPAPTPTPTPTPAPSPTTTRAAGYCRVTLRLPAAARVDRAIRIRVTATDGCFVGATRTLTTALRRDAGPAVPVSWSSTRGRRDIVLRHGVPRPGRWRLDLASGARLAAHETGTLVARR